MYHRIAPMFLVEDVDKAAQWYAGIFGAKLLAKLPERPPFEWVSLTVRDVVDCGWTCSEHDREFQPRPARRVLLACPGLLQC